MGLDTMNIELPGAGSGENKGGAYKGLSAGNCTAKINKIELWEQSWNKHENGLFLVLKLETLKPSPDFEGYPINENDPEGPKHEGYVGNVKISTFAFKDRFDTRTNTNVNRDEEILKSILSLCTELDCVQWFRDAHGKYDTIQEWVEAFNAAKPFEGKYLEFCIACEEYVNKEGKVRKTFYLPKVEKVDNVWHIPYKSLTSTKPLVKYNEDKHFKGAVVESVDSFNADGNAGDDSSIEIDLDGFDI